MPENEVPKDANGREVKSAAKKWVSPTPAPDELVAVWFTSEAGTQDYVYVDPTSALQMDRAVARVRTELGGKLTKSKLAEWKLPKFVRETVIAGFDLWPPAGYVAGKLAELGIAAGPAVAGAPAAAAVAAPAAPVDQGVPVPLEDDEDEDPPMPLPADGQDTGTVADPGQNGAAQGPETAAQPAPAPPSPAPMPPGLPGLPTA